MSLSGLYHEISKARMTYPQARLSAVGVAELSQILLNRAGKSFLLSSRPAQDIREASMDRHGISLPPSLGWSGRGHVMRGIFANAWPRTQVRVVIQDIYIIWGSVRLQLELRNIIKWQDIWLDPKTCRTAKHCPPKSKSPLACLTSDVSGIWIGFSLLSLRCHVNMLTGQPPFSYIACPVRLYVLPHSPFRNTIFVSNAWCCDFCHPLSANHCYHYHDGRGKLPNIHSTH